ncbi:MAG: MFS transporter [Acidiferrobacterales bacterium]|nr:MFS transporter [Acidiferrobacterales bacterium]
MNTESDTSPATAGWKDVLGSGHRRPLALVCLSIWLHASMVTAMSTLIPEIVDEIGGVSLIPWTFALYEIGSIVVGAGSGLLVYRYRLRNPLSCASLVFALGSVICALADFMPILLLGRLLQGVGGGGLIAISFIAVSALFPNHLIPRVLAAVSAIWGASAFLGPLIGAFFAQQLSWQSAFWFFAFMSAVLSIWIRPNVSENQDHEIAEVTRGFPIRRLSVLSVSVLLIAAAGINPSLGKTPIFVLLGIGFLGWFLRMDGKGQDNRLLPHRAIGFQNRVGAGLTMIFCFAIATMAVTVYGPLFMVHIHQVSILTAGYVVACSSVGWSLGAVAVAGISTSRDTRAVMTGMLILTVSIAGFVYAIVNGPVYLLALLALMEGAGFGIAWASILRRMLSLIDLDDRERVSAAIPTLHRLGYAIGAAYIGIVANVGGLEMDVANETVDSVAQWIFLASLPFAILGLYAAYRFVSKSP